MEIKHYKRLSNFIGFLMGVFIFNDVLNYPFLFEDTAENPASFLIPQGVFVLGLVCLMVFYIKILHNIKKEKVFIRKNEKIFRYFGAIILFLGFLSDLLFNFIADERPSGTRILAVLGGTLLFISFFFKIGIKLKEEQDLTI
ncbi:MAG: DUF2975 domain-containing protein [Bacteroidia bacterium]|nr:DUF2975 domain-containing protein [Bacteroidia bacterium]